MRESRFYHTHTLISKFKLGFTGILPRMYFRVEIVSHFLFSGKIKIIFKSLLCKYQKAYFVGMVPSNHTKGMLFKN